MIRTKTVTVTLSEGEVVKKFSKKRYQTLHWGYGGHGHRVNGI